jgi:hypothetical protein
MNGWFSHELPLPMKAWINLLNNGIPVEYMYDLPTNQLGWNHFTTEINPLQGFLPGNPK